MKSNNSVLIHAADTGGWSCHLSGSSVLITGNSCTQTTLLPTWSCDIYFYQHRSVIDCQQRDLHARHSGLCRSHDKEHITWYYLWMWSCPRVLVANLSCRTTYIYIYIYIYIYMCRTALITSRCCILYIIQQIYVQNILNMPHTLRFFFLQNAFLFHNATFYGSCVIHILYTRCAKIKKKKNPAPKG